MAKKAKKQTFGEKVIWYGSIFASLMCFIAAVPFVPWRYARIDTNVGDRFVMDRKYSLMGLSNQMGKQEGWLTMRKKIERKVEEFGRPNALTALLGTGATMLGLGGSAMGCAMWTVCKEHIAQRSQHYATVGAVGIAAMLSLVISAAAGGGAVLLLNFEEDDEKKLKKKKKKKSDDEGLSPKAKTMVSTIVAFVLSSGATTSYICVTLVMFNDFKMGAYYPFAGAHVGAFVAGFGCFVQWIIMLTAINRVTPFCGKKKNMEEEDAGEQWQQQMQYQQQYGGGQYGGGGPGYPYGGPGAFPQQY